MDRKMEWATREISPHINISFQLYDVEGQLDDRLKIYDREAILDDNPCSAPLWAVAITCNGDVALCCYDWKRLTTFGNLNDKSLEEILSSDAVQETYKQLTTGNRFLDVCKRCGVTRRE
jgi:radical SAM protein with 4Fe4S-binding SPASM domain